MKEGGPLIRWQLRRKIEEPSDFNIHAGFYLEPEKSFSARTHVGGNPADDTIEPTARFAFNSLTDAGN